MKNKFLSQPRSSVRFKKPKISSTHPQKSAIGQYSSIQSITPNQSILLSFHLRLGLANILESGWNTESFWTVSRREKYLPQNQFRCIFRPAIIMTELCSRRANTMNFLVMNFSPSSCYLFPSKSKYCAESQKLYHSY